jgi:hypothetical protein
VVTRCSHVFTTSVQDGRGPRGSPSADPSVAQNLSRDEDPKSELGPVPRPGGNYGRCGEGSWTWTRNTAEVRVQLPLTSTHVRPADVARPEDPVARNRS